MAGRPTDYSKEISEQAWAYIENYSDYGHAIPSVVGLCQVIKRARSTVYDWAKREDTDFSDILEAINEKQELVTFNMALIGEYNATIAKLLLGKHGYSDKGEVKTDHTSSDGSMTPQPTRIEIVAPDDNGEG